MKDEYDFSKGKRGAIKFDNIIDGTCQLVHRDGNLYEAIAYFMQDFSDGVSSYQVMIPVCKGCIDKLKNKNWKLWYCMSCNESWWIPKNESKKKELYDNNEVKWQRFCKNCYKINKKGDN